MQTGQQLDRAQSRRGQPRDSVEAAQPNMPTDQMPDIDAYRRAQRQTNTVQADRLMLARLLKHGQSSTAFRKKFPEWTPMKSIGGNDSSRLQ